jgi:hypothetical protein
MLKIRQDQLMHRNFHPARGGQIGHPRTSVSVGVLLAVTVLSAGLMCCAGMCYHSTTRGQVTHYLQGDSLMSIPEAIRMRSR